MTDDPYKTPKHSSVPKIVTNQKRRSAVIFLADLVGIAAAWWIADRLRGPSSSVVGFVAVILFAFSNTIWSFVWPVIEHVEEDDRDDATGESTE